LAMSIEADGAEPDRVERGRGDERLGKDLYQPQRLDELAFAAIARKRRRSAGDNRGDDTKIKRRAAP
jgi:hypothetical protein